MYFALYLYYYTVILGDASKPIWWKCQWQIYKQTMLFHLHYFYLSVAIIVNSGEHTLIFRNYLGKVPLGLNHVEKVVKTVSFLF
jgi:hypothetical protein